MVEVLTTEAISEAEENLVRTDGLQRWLKYWILFSVFLTLQIPGDWVLSWALGFSLAKIAFLLLCKAQKQK